MRAVKITDFGPEFIVTELVLFSEFAYTQYSVLIYYYILSL